MTRSEGRSINCSLFIYSCRAFTVLLFNITHILMSHHRSLFCTSVDAGFKILSINTKHQTTTMTTTTNTTYSSDTARTANADTDGKEYIVNSDSDEKTNGREDENGNDNKSKNKKEVGHYRKNSTGKSITGGDSYNDGNNSSFMYNCMDHEEFLHIKEYLDSINNFDIKFCQIRLLNAFVFLLGSALYVCMDALPYSGLYRRPTAADDDYYETDTNSWINKYTIVYLSAAFMFTITALIDFYLVYLVGSRSDEAQMQIVNRQEAMSRARKRSSRQDGTLMGLPCTPVSMYDIDSEDDDHRDMDHPNRQYCRKFQNLISKFRRSISMVTLVCWALLLGGITGCISAVFVLKHILISDIFNAISVHLFFIQACVMIYARLCASSSSNSNRIDDDNNSNINEDDDDDDDDSKMIFITRWMLIGGDFSFALGASIDVTYSYVYIFRMINSDYFKQAVATLLSGILWLLASITYLIVALYDYYILKREIRKELDSLVLLSLHMRSSSSMPPETHHTTESNPTTTEVHDTGNDSNDDDDDDDIKRDSCL